MPPPIEPATGGDPLRQTLGHTGHHCHDCGIVLARDRLRQRDTLAGQRVSPGAVQHAPSGDQDDRAGGAHLEGPESDQDLARRPSRRARASAARNSSSLQPDIAVLAFHAPVVGLADGWLRGEDRDHSLTGKAAEAIRAYLGALSMPGPTPA